MGHAHTEMFLVFSMNILQPGELEIFVWCPLEDEWLDGHHPHRAGSE